MLLKVVSYITQYYRASIMHISNCKKKVKDKKYWSFKKRPREALNMYKN